MEKEKNNSLFESGEKLAEMTTMLWDSQPEPPKIHIGAYRIHHYGAGIALSTLGLLMVGFGKKENMIMGEFLAGFGTGLLVDDMNDFLDDLRKLERKVNRNR